MLLLKLLLTFAGVAFGVAAAVYVARDIRRRFLRRELSRHPLPPGTRLVEIRSVSGKGGAGSGWAILTAVLLHSDLPEPELRAFYKDTCLLRQESARFSSGLLEHTPIYFRALQDVQDFSGYYVLVTFDAGLFSLAPHARRGKQA